MKKNETDNILKNFHDIVKEKHPKVVVDFVFGLSDLKYYIKEIIEEYFFEYFTTRTLSEEFYEIFRYDDIYDYLNTITKIHYIDLEMNYNWQDISNDELKLFVLDTMKWINRKLNAWIMDKNSGYRKKTKIFLQMQNDESIILYFKQDLKLK